MEQGPHLFYDRQESSADLPPGHQNSPERAQPAAERLGNRAEVLPSSKTFEQMVHDALEEELKYERDPALRDKAAKRADEILAEFQEAKSMGGAANPASSDASTRSKDSDQLTPELANQLGIKQDKTDRLDYPRSSLNFGVVDLVMAIVIAVLLIIVILLLIF